MAVIDVDVLGDGKGETTQTPEPRPARVRNTPELRRRVLIAVIVVWAVVITAVVLLRGNDSATPPQAAVAPSPSPSASDAPLTVAKIYQALRPSVVQIRSTGGTLGANESETGSGSIVNADGTILTARHVIAGAGRIEVAYADGTTATATVASQDAKQDIATLTPATLPGTVVPAVLGGGVAVGDAVVAIGNPLGLTATTTSGVVSGLDRQLSNGPQGSVSGLIQFDAAVNPGSSGGPLINDRGQVVGVVVALANPTDAGTFIGIGFAVPIGTALGAGRGDGRTPPL